MPRDKSLKDGRPTAYVCRNYTCHAPVTSAVDLVGQLDAGGWHG